MGVAFWTKIRDFAAARVREAYININGSDRMCPRCLTWTSEVNGAADYKVGERLHDWMTCNKCGHISRWRMDGPVPFLDEPAHHG
jgi:hypothetical protein